MTVWTLMCHARFLVARSGILIGWKNMAKCSIDWREGRRGSPIIPVLVWGRTRVSQARSFLLVHMWSSFRRRWEWKKPTIGSKNNCQRDKENEQIMLKEEIKTYVWGILTTSVVHSSSDAKSTSETSSFSFRIIDFVSFSSCVDTYRMNSKTP